MKFIIGNRKTIKEWTDTIVDTKKGLNFRNINQHFDATNYLWDHNDSVSDIDTTPPFQTENQ